MKYFLSALCAIVVLLVVVFVPFQKVENTEYLRVHIRANSNSVIDQNVKYKVKDKMVENILPILQGAKSFDEAKKKLEENVSYIEGVANSVLKNDGLNYRSHAGFKREYFSTKTYQGKTIKEGVYQAFIIDLGSGEGNNWWCLLFPSYCFTKTSSSDKVEYISLIWEIINHIT